MPARWVARVVGGWLVLGFVVFNGFFDILVSRGEKQYLLGQARHELGVGPEVTLDEVMTTTIRDAAGKAAAWGGLVFAAGVAGTWYVRRRSLRERASR